MKRPLQLLMTASYSAAVLLKVVVNVIVVVKVVDVVKDGEF